MEQLLTSTTIQYGFAGLSVILLVFLFLVVNKVFGVLEANTQVISQNTSAFQGVMKGMDEVKQLQIECKDKLNSRPCIAKKE